MSCCTHLDVTCTNQPPVMFPEGNFLAPLNYFLVHLHLPMYLQGVFTLSLLHSVVGRLTDPLFCFLRVHASFILGQGHQFVLFVMLCAEIVPTLRTFDYLKYYGELDSCTCLLAVLKTKLSNENDKCVNFKSCFQQRLCLCRCEHLICLDVFLFRIPFFF